MFEPCKGLYTHYSLPNLFGNDNIEHSIDDFYYLGNSSLTSGCTKDSSLFCAFAFPPCYRDSIQTLPCLSLCRVTVEACADTMPFPLDCEGYPTEQPCLEPLFLPVVTTATPDICQRQSYERCRRLGFEVTGYPTWFAENETANIAAFEQWALPAVVSQCHPQAEFFMCAMFFPRCNELHKNVTRPCRSLCQDVENRCYNNGDILNIDCTMFETDHTKCVIPEVVATTTVRPVTTTVITVKPTTTPVMKHQCLPITMEDCLHFGHVNGSIPNTWGAHNEAEIRAMYYTHGQPVVSSGCYDNALFYTCAMLFPKCDNEIYPYPCRTVCEEYNSRCTRAPGFIHQVCSFFPTQQEDPECLLPPNKRTCAANQFQCEGVPRCIPLASVCNGLNDCVDWSDERQCDCNEDFEWRCDMGLCVRNHQRCDNQTNCPDGSDERGCSKCVNGQFECHDGTCIMLEWVCDGHQDCPWTDDHDDVAEDEANCTACRSDEFSCTNKQCVPYEQRCDGTPHCADHSDESKCIMTGPPVLLNVMGTIMPVCVVNFTEQLADVACQRLGFSKANAWLNFSTEYFEFSHLFQIAANGRFRSLLGTGSVVSHCGNGNVVELVCDPAECGQRINFGNFITNGEDAKSREVPWQVSIQEYGKHFCGGTIIHPYFIMTAAHCMEKYTLNFETVDVVLGAVNFKVPESGRKSFRVKRILIHPNYVTFMGNDVALVELTKAVTYSADIQPLCLRAPGDVFTRGSLCYTSGWGQMNPSSDEMATRLQIVKMSLWDTRKCNSSFAWDGQLQQTEICAGYYAGIKAACRGDSGGPLFCEDNDFTWKLVGVASYVHVGCNKPEKPVVYSDARLYNEWIANNTKCQFHCRNRRCLYDKAMVCNKVDDCGDNSDEVDSCDVSANCTFDDPYLCGYRSDWLWVTEALVANRYPLFDHSVGRYPGMFLLGAFRGKSLHTPRIDLTSSHCFRFRYHMRGRVVQGMAVFVHELSVSGQWTKVWSRDNNHSGLDRWYLGQFNLDPGHYDIVFSPYDDGMVTVDDTELLNGKCTQTCGQGEFMCETDSLFNCLPIGVRCNLVMDCDNIDDELDCADYLYTCDFENMLLCGLEQDTEDSGKAEWRLQNASRAGFGDASGNSQGHMLQIITERMLTTDHVYMIQRLYLGNVRHCLAFSYRSTSTVKLFIDLHVDGETDITVIWSMENRQTDGWTKTQVPLPPKNIVYLFYVVSGRDLDRSVFHPMVAIDDITITVGACSPFTCPSGQRLCGTEAYCLAASRFCDRKVDCLDYADEINCTCLEDEYKCPTGACIPRSKTCDTARDCPDGSDEGAICDSLRSVSCDFEHRFMCGYTHNGSRLDSVPYVWSRERNVQQGAGINIGTGPIYDHTSGTESGHWAFANGENGQPFNYVALESPFFASTGNDIFVFYYFAYSMFSQFWITGSLGVLLNNGETGTHVKTWYREVDGNNTWRSACVVLPRSTNMSVSLVAMRGQSQKADLAVDDVQLIRQRTCDQFYVESRLAVGASIAAPIQTVTSPAGCTSNEFQCRNGMCIDASFKCDNILDCLDKSDENDCPSPPG